jgi:hypothetical protein
MFRGLRGLTRASRQREKADEDLHARAQADFIKLGEGITRLDVDSSLATASPAAKDEYRHALGCYEAAEKRLKPPDDDYQFQKAQWAIKAGLRHIRAADLLFNPPPDRATQVEQLAKLVELHMRGGLTDKEFGEQEQKLLG